MAKFTVTFCCGHVQDIDLYGSPAEIERKISVIKDERLCPDCLARIRKQESDAHLSFNLEQSCLPLSGSVKQTMWGETLRSEMIRQELKIIEKESLKLEQINDKKKRAEIENNLFFHEFLLAQLKTIKHARKFIDLHKYSRNWLFQQKSKFLEQEPMRFAGLEITEY